MSEKQTANPTVVPTNGNDIIGVRRELFKRLEIADLPRDVLIDSIVGSENYSREFVDEQLTELRKTGEVYEVPICDGDKLEVRRT